MRRAAIAACLLLAACSPSAPVTTPTGDELEILVESEGFQNGTAIPEVYTCDGRNISPALEWFGVPEDTIELALVVRDLDATGGVFIHWTVWGMDPGVTGVGIDSAPEGGVQGQTSAGSVGYTGPCPQPGDPQHEYVFTVTAMRGKVIAEEGAEPANVLQRIEDLKIAEGHLRGF